MDFKILSNTLLEIFYIIVGLFFILTMMFTLKDKNHKTKYGTALFWGILGVIFILGEFIPPVISGLLIVIIGVLAAFNQINIGTIKQLDATFANLKANKIWDKNLYSFINNCFSCITYCSIHTNFRGCCCRYCCNNCSNIYIYDN